MRKHGRDQTAAPIEPAEDEARNAVAHEDKNEQSRGESKEGLGLGNVHRGEADCGGGVGNPEDEWRELLRSTDPGPDQ